ncbi:MAG: helix-turn-helix domain-containing protein [Lachnospirales bacterium]
MNNKMFEITERIKKQREKLNFNLQHLADLTGMSKSTLQRYDIPLYVDENIESYIDLADNIKVDFCLRAKGDSMINSRIFNNAIVFVRK